MKSNGEAFTEIHIRAVEEFQLIGLSCKSINGDKIYIHIFYFYLYL